MKKRHVFILSLLLLTGFMPVRAEGTDDIADGSVKILFTQSLQAAISGYKTEVTKETQKEDGTVETEVLTKTFGGFARVASAIDTYRTDNAILLDGGDFSTGSVYDSLYAKEAPALTLMGMMGYDAAALGEREFTYGMDMFKAMLEASPEEIPTLLCANPDFNDDTGAEAVFSAKGGKAYKVIERGGFRIGVFGLTDTDLRPGTDEDEAVSSCLEGLEGCDLIICLYHSDNFEKIQKLIQKHKGIDVLLAGHSILPAEEVTYVEQTAVISAGEGGRYLGMMEITPKDKQITDYRLYALDPDVYGENPEIREKVNSLAANVQANMMNRYGYTNGQVIASSLKTFTDIRDTDSLSNNAMAELLAASLCEAYEREEYDNHPVLSIISREMVTGRIVKGNITIEDIYHAAGYGMDEFGIVGEPLLRVYMRGSDLLDACEIDRSMFADEEEHQMYFGNMYYVYSDQRGELNRVEEVYVASTRQYYTPIEKDKLYPVITTESILRRLKQAADSTGGDLRVTARTANGFTLGDFSQYRLADDNGALKKPWTVLADYLKERERNQNNVPEIAKDDFDRSFSRKADTSFDLIRFFRNTSSYGLREYGKTAAAVLGAIIGLRLLIWLLNLKPKKEKN